MEGTAELPDLSGIEVVVVDDDVATVEAIGAALGKAGAMPRLAQSVPEALLLLERGTPDVLVSDIGLPDRDGFDSDPRRARARRSGPLDPGDRGHGARRTRGAAAHPARGLRLLPREAGRARTS